jgi:hypothetical protein
MIQILHVHPHFKPTLRFEPFQMLSEANFVPPGLHARRVEYLARRQDNDGVFVCLCNMWRERDIKRRRGEQKERARERLSESVCVCARCL